ncbi:putative ribonuclease H-like domain-containing protein [Tanacetum coccineum]
MHALEDDSIFDCSSDDVDDGTMTDMNNLDTTIQVSPIPTTRIHKDHPLNQVIRDLQSSTLIRKISQNLEEHRFHSQVLPLDSSREEALSEPSHDNRRSTGEADGGGDGGQFHLNHWNHKKKKMISEELKMIVRGFYRRNGTKTRSKATLNEPSSPGTSSEPMPTIPTQSPFTYPNPNPSASPLFTQDDTSESFIPEPTQPMPTFTQTAFSQPATQPTQNPNNVQSQQFQQFQTATISANNAKFPYLEKEKYEIWAMKMEYWIQNADHNLWRIVRQGNSPKRLGKDAKGNTIVHPPVSLDEHVAIQRENKVRTLLLQALPEDHMPDFHHYDDARDIWMAVKARFSGNEESKKIRKTILKALPSSWSQVGLALKTRGGLDSMNFDDLYNKLRSLKLDVRIGHSYGVKAAAAPTHYAFIGATSSGKLTYSDQQSIVPLTLTRLISWRWKNWPLRANGNLSLRNNSLRKKAGRKDKPTTISEPARFDKRKVICYKCLQLGHFTRECNVKTVDDKARYSAFKVTEVKTDEPKALVSVNSMVNWSDHAAENKTGEVVEKVYGMMAGLHAYSADVSDAAAEFAMMGISPKVQNCPLGCDSKINDLNHMYNNLDRLYNDCYIKVQAYQHAVKTLESQKDWYHKTQIALEEKIRVLSANLENTTNTLSYTEKLHDQAQNEKKEWEVKYEATLARFDKWKESSKNLKKLINSSMSTRTKIGLGFQEYFGVDEVFDLSTPIPPSITGTYMPIPYKSDIEETQVSYGSKSDNKTSETLSESNDFVSCDNSDKSSDSETYASCDSSLKTKTKDFPPAVDIKTLPESDVEDPNSTAGSPSFSCLENVKSPRIFCNKSGMNNRNVCKNNFVRVKKCFVCGSKLHLIKDCDFYNCVDSVPCKSKAASVPAGSRNSSASVTAGGSAPAASRNRPAVNSAGRPNPTGRVGQAAHLVAAQSNPTGWSKRPTPVFAGRPVSASWFNPAARPYFRPLSVYFNNMYWPKLYDPMYMNEGRWGTTGNLSTDNDIGIVDSGCSRSMTRNKEKLNDFVQIRGGIVKFRGGDSRISGKGTIRTSKLDFENVYYVEELQHFNLRLPITERVKVVFTNEHNCVACNKGKQHKASYKHISAVRLITDPLQLLHMDLFGPTNIRSIDQKYYSLVVTDDFSRVSITNPHNKTPYELISGKVPQIGHLKPFGCQVTILNTSDHLGKFEGKADEGYLVGYAPNSKAYRVYNLTNKRVEETMNLRFLEDKPNVQGIGTQETNTNAGTQDSDSESECWQVIVVPSFPSNTFAGPSSSNGPSVMERNADYAEELAKLQRQEYEAKDAAARYGYLFSQATAEILSQAEAEIRNQGVSADRDPAGIDSADSVSAGSDSAGVMNLLAQGNPAVSTSVSADFSPVHADECYSYKFSTCCGSESSSYKKGEHNSSSVTDIGDLASPVLTRSRAQKSKFGESAFIGYVQDQQRINHTDQLHCLFACFLSQLEPTSIAKALEDPDWVAAMQE